MGRGFLIVGVFVVFAGIALAEPAPSRSNGSTPNRVEESGNPAKPQQDDTDSGIKQRTPPSAETANNNPDARTEHQQDGGTKVWSFLPPGFVEFFEGHEHFWVAFGTVVIAGFTVALALSTVFLFVATLIAARAARAAVEHVPIVEQAYVYPRIVDQNIAASIIDASEPAEDGFGNIAQSPRIEFQVVNYGKTVAFIEDIHGGLRCPNDDPSQVIVRNTDDWHIGGDVALEPSGESETFTYTLSPRLSESEAAKIIDGRIRLYFEGYIAFKTVWGAEITQHFWFTWNHTKSVFVPAPGWKQNRKK